MLIKPIKPLQRSIWRCPSLCINLTNWGAWFPWGLALALLPPLPEGPCSGKALVLASRGMACRGNELQKVKCYTGTWWGRHAQLAPSPWAFLQCRRLDRALSPCYLWDISSGFSGGILGHHFPSPTQPSAVTSRSVVGRTSRRGFNIKNQPTDRPSWKWDQKSSITKFQRGADIPVSRLAEGGVISSPWQTGSRYHPVSDLFILKPYVFSLTVSESLSFTKGLADGTGQHWAPSTSQEAAQKNPCFGWFQGVSTIPPGGMRSDAPALPPKAPPAGVTSCLLSAQLLLTGESLHLSSSSPLHSWLKIHFKNKFIYILITSVITITLPLLRNSSAACRSLSLSEISEKRGLVVCRARSPTGCFSRNERKPSGHPELCCSPKFSLQVHLILVTRGQDRSDHFRNSTQSSVGCLN